MPPGQWEEMAGPWMKKCHPPTVGFLPGSAWGKLRKLVFLFFFNSWVLETHGDNAPTFSAQNFRAVIPSYLLLLILCPLTVLFKCLCLIIRAGYEYVSLLKIQTISDKSTFLYLIKENSRSPQFIFPCRRTVVFSLTHILHTLFCAFIFIYIYRDKCDILYICVCLWKCR